MEYLHIARGLTEVTHYGEHVAIAVNFMFGVGLLHSFVRYDKRVIRAYRMRRNRRNNGAH